MHGCLKYYNLNLETKCKYVETRIISNKSITKNNFFFFPNIAEGNGYDCAIVENVL